METISAHADHSRRTAQVSGSKNRLDRPAVHPGRSLRRMVRRGSLRRGVAAVGAMAVLAVGGFGAISPAQAQEAHVKQSNYAVVQVQADARTAAGARDHED